LYGDLLIGFSETPSSFALDETASFVRPNSLAMMPVGRVVAIFLSILTSSFDQGFPALEGFFAMARSPRVLALTEKEADDILEAVNHFGGQVPDDRAFTLEERRLYNRASSLLKRRNLPIAAPAGTK
jgi:hypothetical protein